MGAKQAAKRAAKEAAADNAKTGGNKGGKGKGGQPKQRARDELLPWGWEQQAKDERKKKNAERSQVRLQAGPACPATAPCAVPCSPRT